MKGELHRGCLLANGAEVIVVVRAPALTRHLKVLKLGVPVEQPRFLVVALRAADGPGVVTTDAVHEQADVPEETQNQTKRCRLA